MDAPGIDRRQARIARRLNFIANRRRRSQTLWTRIHAGLYRLTRGRFVPRWFAGAPVLVLETVGRRSGQRRAVPVLYLADGNSFVVLASNAGTDRYPAWWFNLKDAGEASIVVRGSRKRVRPRLLEGAERERLWREFVAMYPQAEEYTRFTDREFPLVALEPV